MLSSKNADEMGYEWGYITCLLVAANPSEKYGGLMGFLMMV
jgi:hypothetical protein